MSITLDLSGKSMKLKVLRGPNWEDFRDRIKLLSDKKPIYNMIDGVHRFDYWDVPISEFGNLLEHIKEKDILFLSDKAKELMEQYRLNTAGLFDLPLFEGNINWKRKPKYQEQEDFIRINQSKTKLVLAPAPGLGKTFISLMRASVLGAKKILVVGPSKSNFTTWRNEIEKTLFDAKVIKYHGSPAKRKKLRESGELSDYDVVYTTYTMIHELNHMDFDQLILDEVHTISNSKTKGFKNTNSYLKKHPDVWRMLLSGTPIKHKPHDYWAITYMIDPIIAGDERAWKKKYEKVIKTFKKKIPVKLGNGEYSKDEHGRIKVRTIEIPIKTAPQNLDHLSEKIKSFTYRLKRDKFVSFEDKVDIEFVEMLPRQKEMYRQAKEELMLELSTGTLKLSQLTLGRITRFLQISEGCFNLDENIGDSGKFDYISDKLDSATDKVIVWSRFKPISHRLYEKYKDNSVIYNGDFTEIQKNVALWNFQGCDTEEDYADWKKYNKTKFTEPGQAQFLFGVINKGSTAGVNLPSCFTQYFTSWDWNGNINRQTGDRIKRLSQEAEEVYTTFVVSETPSNFEQYALQLTFLNESITTGILDGNVDKTWLQLQDLIKRL